VLSLGMPMILMGDEIRRTQRGNNNAYCLDTEANWFDWTLLETHADIHRFVRLLLSRRVTRGEAAARPHLSLAEMLHTAQTTWHGVRLHQPDWSAESHSLALGAEMPAANLELHLMLNAYWEPLDFELPPARREPWRRWIDTALESPEDIVPWDSSAPIVTPSAYRADARSVVILWRRREAGEPTIS
jgi:glycogen operon protein